MTWVSISSAKDESLALIESEESASSPISLPGIPLDAESDLELKNDGSKYPEFTNRVSQLLIKLERSFSSDDIELPAPNRKIICNKFIRTCNLSREKVSCKLESDSSCRFEVCACFQITT